MHDNKDWETGDHFEFVLWRWQRRSETAEGIVRLYGSLWYRRIKIQFMKMRTKLPSQTERGLIAWWLFYAANTGGLLGLCLGFSGLSAVEILYFFTIRLWFRKNGARPSLGRRIKWRFKRFCRRLTGRRSHNVRVTLKKQEIPFWPKGKPGVEVNHIQVQNGVKSTNSLLSGIPEYPAI